MNFEIPLKKYFFTLVLFFIANFKIAHAQVNLNSGLVAYYPFNGNANDASGFNHHPAFNNATLTTDRFGTSNNAYLFNGIDNYMRVPNAPDLNFSNKISIAVWIKPQGFYYGNCHGNSVLIKGTDIDPAGRYLIRFEDGQYLNGNNCSVTTPDTIHQNYWGSGAFLYGGYTPYVQKGEWVSVIYTYDGTNVKLYVNCKLVIDDVIPGLSFTNPYDLFLGKLDSPTHPYWYNGAMDDVRLYNRALTEDEVSYIASDGQVAHTPLQTVSLPAGGSVKIGTANVSSTYQWFPSGPNSDSITVNTDGLYIVETNVNGCTNQDSIMVLKASATHIPFFTAPDTICVSQNINITNIATASSYYWNFCVADILSTPPLGTNLGNPGGALKMPVFSDFVESNGKFYVFVVNHINPSGIVRLDFNNSLLNTPTAVNLGNFGSILRNRLEGIQVIYDNGKWYAFVVGGDPYYGDIPQLVRIDFGSNIENTNPVVTDLGNIGSMYQPLDLYMFKENNDWHAFTVNKDGSISRFHFSNGLNNPPIAQNYNLGLSYPTGINVINENGYWYAFITTATNNSIARLEFGNSLLNNPTVINLGNPGNTLTESRDIYVMRFCDQIVGFVVNGPNTGLANQLIRLDFHNDLANPPSATSLGNIGSLAFPHSISKLFRVGDKVYSFITNVNNNTITRIEFPSCTNASTPSFSGQTPPPVTYNSPGVYNINLTIDDGLPTQASYCRQVVVVPAPVHTPLKTILLLPGDSVKIGTGNVSGNYKWNSTAQNSDSITVKLAGLYYVETTGYGCANIDSFRVIFTTADFSYEQDPCDPLRVTFKNESPGSTVIDWDLGNGQTAPGNPNPVATYPALGNYSVTLNITNSGGLNESVTKEVAVQVQNDNIIITNDTTICKDATIQLNAISALSYCWTPSATLSAVDIADPVASPVTTTTYYLNSTVTGSNLIVNGDFSAGNTGFTSGYTYVSTNTTEGEYYIGNNPRAWNPNFSSNCPDHSGAGNMMLVNGNPTPDMNVWSQTIAVTPNTNYAFSTWLQSLFNDNPAQLMFSINGIPVGNMITAGLPVCNWTQFYTTWNSGNNTTAVISIINKNTIVWGNDFALDDISFAPVYIKRDSVTIAIEEPVIKTNADTTVCEGSPVQLQTQGVNFVSYIWLPASGLTRTDIADPVALPATTTEYIINGTTGFGCMASDSVTVTIIPKPVLAVTNDTVICKNTAIQLNATAANVSYIWTPAASLSGTSIANPVATPSVNTTYTVTATGLVTGCKSTDSVKIDIREYPVFSASKDAEICYGESIRLQAGGGDTYEWSSIMPLDDPYASNITILPSVTSAFAVHIAESTCGYDTLIHVNVMVHPSPLIVAQKSNDINCVTTTAQLSARGGEKYIWSPSIHLDNANVHNPVASPDQTTTFFVKGTNQYGCSSADSIVVAVTKEGNPLYLIPNTFTPNGDGINDCLSLKKWGYIQLEEFSIYNRWGEKIFSTKNRMDCWDGTYKGMMQPNGTFIYVIRAKTFCGDINRKGLVTLIR